MTHLPTRLMLAAAVAAVGLGASSLYAGDDEKGACGACTEGSAADTMLVSTAAQQASADEMLAKYRAFEMPRPDMSRREDKAYIEEFMEKQKAAAGEKVELGRAFVLAHPEHPEAGKVFDEMVPMRVFTLGQEPQVRQDVEKLLAQENLGDELRKTLEITQVRLPFMTGKTEDPEAAWNAVVALAEKYPEDQKVAQLMGMAAESAPEPQQRIDRIKQALATFPDSPALKYSKGKIRQAEGVGQPFELEFTDAVSGDTLTSEDLKGKVVVLDFWATWCGPCIAEMPKMKELYAKYKDKGVEFVGISLDAPEAEGGKDKLLAYCKENDITWPQYYQGNGWESEFSTSWGINSIPAIFILDADGNLHSTEARGKLETLIPELLAKRDGGEAETAGGQAGDGRK